MRLPVTAEPLVVDPAIEPDFEVECYATRQMRRRARRAEAKAARRRGEPVAPIVIAEAVGREVDFVAVREDEQAAAVIEPIAEMVAAIAEAPVDTSVDSLVEALAKVRAELAPVAEPALAADPEPVADAASVEAALAAPLPTSRALARQPSGFLARVFGGWWRKPDRLARRDPDALTEQMLVLRTEIALVQMRLDRIIAATSA